MEQRAGYCAPRAIRMQYSCIKAEDLRKYYRSLQIDSSESMISHKSRNVFVVTFR